MRIGQIATTAGVTQRTVRHYHRLGLVPEPKRQSNGYRLYGLEELVRLIRVRWLADNGVPLGSVAAILDRDNTTEPKIGRDANASTDVVTDLTELLSGLRAEQDSLARRCDRLARMLDAVKDGRRISALPAAVVDVFAAVEDAVADDNLSMEAVRRDREALEALAISGAVTDEMLMSLSDVAGDPARRRTYVDALTSWSHLLGRNPGDSAVRAQISAVAAELAEVTAPIFDLAESPSSRKYLDDGEISTTVPDPAQRAAIVEAVELLLDRAAQA